MADTLEPCKLTCSLIAKLTNAVQSSSASVDIKSTDVLSTFSFTDGTTSGKADTIWFDEGRTLTGTTPEDIDLYDLASVDIGAGAGKGPLGNTYANAEICGLLIFNHSSSSGNIFVGGKNATTAWNSIFAIAGVADDTAQIGPLKPNSFFCVGCSSDPAWAVADTSNHLLTLTPTANATYSIYFIGRSA